jgi:F-type H+-transporting ATPase subunit b
MLIDWFTVGAQVLNFLILVLLLKHFLYKPILHAIDEREKKIAAELADASLKKTEAKKEQDEFAHKNQEFDKQRELLFRKATQDASVEKTRLLDQAKQDADIYSKKRMDSLIEEEVKLQKSIIKRIKEGVLAISRKALKDLSGLDLDERIVNVFVGQLKGSLLNTSNTPVTVRTAFTLSSDLQATVEHQIKDVISSSRQVRFETNPDLIGGIEITSNGQKIAWNIADYVNSLERKIEEIAKKMPEVKPATKPEATS